MSRIVIVEDEVILRKGLLMTTDWQKYHCHVIGEAANGQEGLELCLKLKPDIILTDIKMPVMDGITMVDQILKEYQPVVIFMSAFSEFKYAKKAIEFRAVEYLLKPFDDESLENALLKAIQKVKSQQLLNDKVSQLDEKLDTLTLTVNSKHHNLLSAIAYLHQHYQQELTIAEVAQKLNVSESYLSHLFKQESEYTFLEYLTRYRLIKACQLLKDPQYRIHEVANLVGYRDQRYFSYIFRKHLGITPKQFKEQAS